jgi:hypothetical protein
MPWPACWVACRQGLLGALRPIVVFAAGQSAVALVTMCGCMVLPLAPPGASCFAGVLMRRACCCIPAVVQLLHSAETLPPLPATCCSE